MIAKERLIKQIQDFPDRMDIDELIERLLFINKIEKRLELSEADDTILKMNLKKK